MRTGCRAAAQACVITCGQTCYRFTSITVIWPIRNTLPNEVARAASRQTGLASYVALRQPSYTPPHTQSAPKYGDAHRKCLTEKRPSKGWVHGLFPCADKQQMIYLILHSVKQLLPSYFSCRMLKSWNQETLNLISSRKGLSPRL